MIRQQKLALAALSLLAFTTTAFAQPELWSDDFDDPTGWVKGLMGEMSETNQQLVISGNFGPTPPANATDSYAYCYHSIPTSGPLPDGQALEARVDLVAANQNDAFAHLQFVWMEGLTTHSYTLAKDQDVIGLIKAWNSGGSVAYLAGTNQPLKNHNVTLVLALTRLGSAVEINGRVLDKDDANKVLFESVVTDTPQSDPVVPSDLGTGLVTVPDQAGTPWPTERSPGSVLLGMAWVNTQSGSDGAAAVTFDNLVVRQYELPQLAIQHGIVLSWLVPQGQFILVSAPTLNGPWEPVIDPWSRTINGRMEVSVQTSSSQRFFRLREGP